MSLEFGKGHLDRVQIGAVGREEEEPRAARFQNGGGLFAFVARQIIEDDHVAGLEGRRELRLDPGLEDVPVHGTVDDPGRGQSIVTQRGDEGLGPQWPNGAFIFSRRPRRAAASSSSSFRSRRQKPAAPGASSSTAGGASARRGVHERRQRDRSRSPAAFF